MLPLLFRCHRPHPGVPDAGAVRLTSEGLSFEEAIVGRDEAVGTGGLTADLKLLQGAADVLASAHALGVLHLDLKAEHVLRSAEGRTYVLDWDTAILWRRYRQTRGFGFCGTPASMAPEQARGDLSQLSPRTDVFALGLLLYEILHGAPARPLAPTFRAQLDLAKSEPVRCAPEIARRRPQLARLLTWATDPSPARRPASAAHFRDALVEAMGANAHAAAAPTK